MDDEKAVILRCLKSSAGCTGSSCFNVLNDKNETLARYGEEGPQIWHVLLAMDVEIL